MSYLSVAHLEKSFGSTRVLRDVSFDLPEGETLSVIGSSGSGKTTLLRCLNFLERPDAGVISLRDQTLLDGSRPPVRERELREKRLHFGLVFQDFNLFPQYTALENVTLARRLAKLPGESEADIRDRGLALLEQMGLTRENLMACGDGLNDRSMISYAGVGVAMQNAEDAVKAVADYVTAADNNHDGVAEAIEKFILN